jgi:hypothetical protein
MKYRYGVTGPGGTVDNSPAFLTPGSLQEDGNASRRDARTFNAPLRFKRPYRTRFALLISFPGVETPGYCQASLAGRLRAYISACG